MEWLPLLGGIGGFSTLAGLLLYFRQKGLVELQAQEIAQLKSYVQTLKSTPKLKRKMTKIDDLQAQMERNNRRFRYGAGFMVVFALLLTVGGVGFVTNQLQNGVEENRRLNEEALKLNQQQNEKLDRLLGL